MPDSSSRPRFAGVIPPILTPLEDDHSLDEPGLERLLEHIIDGGVHGLFVLGTTGEGPSIPIGMRLELIRCVRQMSAGRVRLIANVTSTCMDDSLKMARTAAQHGFDAVAAAPPFYFPLRGDDLLAHYRQLAARSPLPLLLYNIPSHTKLNLTVEMVRALTQEANVVGIKDSTFDMNGFEALMKLAGQRPDWTFLVGGERCMVQTMRMGGHGCVGGGANIWPRAVVQLYDAVLAGDEATISRLDPLMQRMGGLFATAGPENGPILALKHEAGRRGLCSARVAPPLRPIDEPRLGAMAKVLEDLRVLDDGEVA